MIRYDVFNFWDESAKCIRFSAHYFQKMTNHTSTYACVILNTGTSFNFSKKLTEKTMFNLEAHM